MYSIVTSYSTAPIYIFCPPPPVIHNQVPEQLHSKQSTKKLAFLPQCCPPGSNCATCCVCQSLSRVQLYATPQAAATRLLYPWASPANNTGVGSLLQGILPTQGSNWVSCITSGLFTTSATCSEDQSTSYIFSLLFPGLMQVYPKKVFLIFMKQ